MLLEGFTSAAQVEQLVLDGDAKVVSVAPMYGQQNARFTVTLNGFQVLAFEFAPVSSDYKAWGGKEGYCLMPDSIINTPRMVEEGIRG